MSPQKDVQITAIGTISLHPHVSPSLWPQSKRKKVRIRTSEALIKKTFGEPSPKAAPCSAGLLATSTTEIQVTQRDAGNLSLMQVTQAEGFGQFLGFMEDCEMGHNMQSQRDGKMARHGEISADSCTVGP